MSLTAVQPRRVACGVGTNASRIQRVVLHVRLWHRKSARNLWATAAGVDMAVQPVVWNARCFRHLRRAVILLRAARGVGMIAFLVQVRSAHNVPPSTARRTAQLPQWEWDAHGVVMSASQVRCLVLVAIHWDSRCVLCRLRTVTGADISVPTMGRAKNARN
jgi:hypothetical protein